MSRIQAIARETRRGLFGTAVPARQWDAALEDFQTTRDTLTRATVELSESTHAKDHPAWSETVDALTRQMSLMDGAATTILTCAGIANGVEELFPGFNGINVGAAFGISGIAAPVTITLLRALTAGARHLISRADDLLDNSQSQSVHSASSGLGQYAPWGNIGGDVWEWLHAEQVQREYEAVGKPAPSIEEIREGALLDIGERVSEGAASVLSGTKTIMIAAAVIAVAVFVLPRMTGRVK